MHCGNQKPRLEVAWQRTGVMRLGGEAGVESPDALKWAPVN